MKKIQKKKLLCLTMAMAVALTSVGIGTHFSKSTKSSASNSLKVTTAEERLQAERNKTMASYHVDESKDENEVVRAIVNLKEDSVVEENEKNAFEYTSKLKSEEQKILDGQENIIKKVEKITDNKVENQSAYLVNSFSIDATRAQIKKIAQLSGVESVYESSTYTVEMTDAVEVGNVTNEWNSREYGYTGEGTVVAILDSGVNYKHKDMVLDEGVKTKYTKEQWEEKIKLLGHGSYKTEKVPFAYDYGSGVGDCLVRDHESGTHGYHVAGITAANGEIKGVAKNAQVLGLQVLPESGGDATLDTIVKGIEDAVKLGADVINMSLGIENVAINDDDIFQEAVNKATEAGVVCCISASNDGTSTSTSGSNTNELNMKDTSSINTPSIAKNSITVAAAHNYNKKDIYKAELTLNKEKAKFNYIPNTDKELNWEKSSIIDLGNGTAEEIANVKRKTLKDKFVLVKDADVGTVVVNLTAKLTNIRGVIYIYRNKDNVFDVDEKLASIDKYISIPFIYVKESESQVLYNIAKENTVIKSVTVEPTDSIVAPQKMAYFSSWGPSSELDLKPEITAPGHLINSTMGGEDGYEVASGTSMASPFSAGCSAVLVNALRERGLNLKEHELSSYVKNCLMNTANVIEDSEYKVPYSVRYQGAGMVDLYGAVDNNVIATTNGVAKVELREMKANEKHTFNITLQNYGSIDAKYTLDKAQVYTDYTDNNSTPKQYRVKAVDGAYVKFDKQNVVVPANGKVVVVGEVVLPKTFGKNNYVEAFIQFKGQGIQDIGMPLLGFYGDWSEELIVDTSIYDTKQKGVMESNLGVKSGTGLASKLFYQGESYYGTDIEKVKDIDEENIKTSDSVKDLVGDEEYDALVASGISKKLLNGDKSEIYKLNKANKRKSLFGIPILRDNSLTEIKNITNGYGVAIMGGNDNYYTFDVEANGALEIMILSFSTKNKNYFSFIYDTNIINKLSKEIKLKKDSKYIIVLKKKADAVKGEKIAKIKKYPSSGENAYTLKNAYIGEKVSFSPNGDKVSDNVVPYVTQLRNSKATSVYVLDANKRKIRTIVKDIPVAKYLQSSSANSILGRGRTISYNYMSGISDNSYIRWNGKLYDSKQGKYVTAKEGQYYIQIDSKVSDVAKAQTTIMPVKIDLTKPTLNKYEVTKENNDTILTFNVQDNISMSPYFYVDVENNYNNIKTGYTISQRYVETETDSNGNYRFNLGNIKDGKITILFEDQAGNQVIVDESSKLDENANAEVDLTQKDNETKDTVAPVITVLDDKEIKEKKDLYGNTHILLRLKLIDKFTFRVKVTDDNFDPEAFSIVLGNGAAKNTSYKYEGNGVYKITMKKLDWISNISISVEDKEHNIGTRNISIYKLQAYLLYLKLGGEGIITTSIRGNLLKSEDLNEDGTYTVSGEAKESVSRLKINDNEVVIDPVTRKYSINVPIKYGENIIKYIVEVDDEEYVDVRTLYYDKFDITLNNLPKANKNGVIQTKKQVFNLSGSVSSYSTINDISLNGNCIYSRLYGKTTTSSEKFNQPFACDVKLNKGVNNIEIKVKNIIGHVETKNIVVEYVGK